MTALHQMLRGAAVCVVAVLVASSSVSAQPPSGASSTAIFNGAGHDFLSKTYDLWAFLLDKWYPADAKTPPGQGIPLDAGGNSSAVGTEGSGRTIPPNPFIGADFYVNPNYANEVSKALTKVPKGGSLAKQIQMIMTTSTAVWLDRIAAIYGGSKNGGRYSLDGHMRTASLQAKKAKRPVVLPLVIYDLPNRDCAALASNGELQGAAGLVEYKKDYIDKIVEILAKYNDYGSVRVAAIIEPDSLPNLVTNLGVPACAKVNQEGYYIDGVTYAIQKLGALPNVAVYLDIGHSGWLGWTSNMQAAVTLYVQVIKNAEKGGDGLVRGFTTDVANYTPVVEPFLDPSNQAVLSDNFYQWNPAFDESTYVKLLDKAFANAGFPGMGFVIDTSRNGWKQKDNGEPIDRRQNRANWCNVKMAGMGQLPRATPSISLPIDAFAWVKPPGESDGSGKVTTLGNKPDKDGKRFDPNCDPNNPRLDVARGAPPAGSWFNSEFMTLLSNAQPPIPTTVNH